MNATNKNNRRLESRVWFFVFLSTFTIWKISKISHWVEVFTLAWVSKAFCTDSNWCFEYFQVAFLHSPLFENELCIYFLSIPGTVYVLRQFYRTSCHSDSVLCLLPSCTKERHSNVLIDHRIPLHESFLLSIYCLLKVSMMWIPKSYHICTPSVS